MPEHLRALAAILLIAAPLFVLAKAPAGAAAIAPADFARRRNLWFALTLAAFLTHDFWVFMIVAAALLIYTLPHEGNKPALFCFLLFAVPAIPGEIPGLGPVRQLFAIDYVRLLALVVLLPAWLALRRTPGAERFGALLPDKLLAAYLALLFCLQLPHESFTETLRVRVLYAFTDVFLPYYVASRGLRSLAAFRDTLASFSVAAMVLGAIACLEAAKSWLLYAMLDQALGREWEYGGYLLRAGEGLRAQGTAGHPIPLGYIMVVALGLYLALRPCVPRTLVWGAGVVLLVAGIIAPLSRGPWVGAAALVVVFLALGPSVMKRFSLAGLLGVAVVPPLLASPLGQKVVAYLPFIGTVDVENVTYRQRLVEISMQVVEQSPVFGAHDYRELPIMQALRQGQGIIDIVNTYMGVLLESGVVGLALFAGFFIAAGAGILLRLRALPERRGEHHLLGRALFATLVAILVTISTVSSITMVPIIYWTLGGMAVAYARLIAAQAEPWRSPA